MKRLKEILAAIAAKHERSRRERRRRTLERVAGELIQVRGHAGKLYVCLDGVPVLSADESQRGFAGHGEGYARQLRAVARGRRPGIRVRLIEITGRLCSGKLQPGVRVGWINVYKGGKLDADYLYPSKANALENIFQPMKDKYIDTIKAEWEE